MPFSARASRLMRFQARRAFWSPPTNPIDSTSTAATSAVGRRAVSSRTGLLTRSISGPGSRKAKTSSPCARIIRGAAPFPTSARTRPGSCSPCRLAKPSWSPTRLGKPAAKPRSARMWSRWLPKCPSRNTLICVKNPPDGPVSATTTRHGNIPKTSHGSGTPCRGIPWRPAESRCSAKTRVSKAASSASLPVAPQRVRQAPAMSI